MSSSRFISYGRQSSNYLKSEFSFAPFWSRIQDGAFYYLGSKSRCFRVNFITTLAHKSK